MPILGRMPRRGTPRPVELVEIRILDGPNRFFTRPAVKLEFRAEQAGVAAEVAADAGEAVRRLHVALDLPPPRLTVRESVDRLRAAVAYPWRRRTISQSIGIAAARIARGVSTHRREQAALRSVALGPLPTHARANTPIVAITGTNGKSTTTRLIAHIGTEAGMRVGMTNSDGIYVAGELVEAGDWTGFGGAARILSEPQLDLAVLETARGGILLRGLGYAASDISVVTNVSADHLGLQGIDTLDELAEVKATVVRVARRGGWAVLNADDPRVWAMRRETRARWYPFSLDPAAEGLRLALERGDRGAVLDDGWLVLLDAGHRTRLVPAADLPVTLAGLSRYNIANALAAAAAADALGIGLELIRSALQTFAQDTAANPGRLNLFEREGVIVAVDFAHNVAGLQGLLEVGRALAGARRLRLGLGTAGDRTDEVLYELGRLAGRAADDVLIAEKRHYLRGRDLDEMNAVFRRGIAAGGFEGEVTAAPDEVEAVRALVERCAPGDVAAVMAHADRPQVFAWLADNGFAPVDAASVLSARAADAAG